MRYSYITVDYLLEQDGCIIPIEVKAGHKGKAKSLQQFIIEKNPSVSLCFSSAQASAQNGIHYAPLYNVECWKKQALNLQLRQYLHIVL